MVNISWNCFLVMSEFKCRDIVAVNILWNTLCAVPESQCDDCHERSRLERGITTGKARHQELLDKQSAMKCFVLED